MRVFYPLEVYYPSQVGGPANTVYWVAKHLGEHGFDPVVCATNHGLDPDFPVNEWIDTDGGRAIYVKTRWRNLPLFQSLTALRAVFGVDAVHLSSVFFPATFLSGILARMLGKPIYWSPRGELDPAALIHSAARKRPVLWLLKKIMRGSVRFHSTCEEETEYIRANFGRSADIVQIPNFLELPDPVDRRESSYLLYIGRIHPKKAIDNLLLALDRSAAFRKSDYVLKIAGTGPARFVEELKTLTRELALEDKVQFLGRIQGVEKQQLLADARWTLMPSHTENFGVVVIESMAQSTPVAASKGSPWRSLELERAGFWIENDPDTLAATIERIISMPPGEYQEYRDKCRPFVEQNFDIKKNMNAWLEFYSKGNPKERDSTESDKS